MGRILEISDFSNINYRVFISETSNSPTQVFKRHAKPNFQSVIVFSKYEQINRTKYK